MRVWIFTLALLAASMPIAAQEVPIDSDAMRDIFARGCGDDHGIDRCDDTVQQRMRVLYGFDSSAKLLEQSVTLRRAFFVDGYGNDVAAISFLRRPDATPLVEVRTPPPTGATSPRIVSAAIDSDAWNAAISQSAHFEQQLAREMPSNEDSGGESDRFSICLHAWFVVVEAVDAPRVSPNVLAGTGSDAMARNPALPVEAPMEPGTTRSDAESACSAGLATRYAFEMADIALAALPECSTLERDSFRNTPMVLAECSRLDGDKLAAGEANAMIRKLERALSLNNRQELNWLFVGFGEDRSSLFMAALDGGQLYLSRTIGVDADHAEVSGLVSFTNESGEPVEMADISLRLIRQTGDFVIDTFNVSGRRPFEFDR